MENNYQKFEQNIANEITIEAKDQMPDAYRKTLIRQIGQHGHSEIMNHIFAIFIIDVSNKKGVWSCLNKHT